MFKAINEYYIKLYSKIHALPPEENPYQVDLSLEEICPECDSELTIHDMIEIWECTECNWSEPL